jgi:hypothetical protein
LDGLRKDRDKLWAEAATIEASNEIPRLVLPPDVLEAAKAAQQEHEISDPVYEAIVAALDDMGGEIGMETLYAIVGADRIQQRDPRVQWAIKGAMTRLGWERKKKRTDSGRLKVYRKAAGTQFRWWHKEGSLVGEKPTILSEHMSFLGANVKSMRRQPNPDGAYSGPARGQSEAEGDA